MFRFIAIKDEIPLVGLDRTEFWEIGPGLSIKQKEYGFLTKLIYLNQRRNTFRRFGGNGNGSRWFSCTYKTKHYFSLSQMISFIRKK